MQLPKNLIHKHGYLLLYLVIGTVARIAFGYIHEPWLEAPDQIGWGLLLEESIRGGTLRYDQLIHYPHEGGTILISCLALVLKHIGIDQALTVSAVALDACSRLIQLLTVRKLTNGQTYHAFGIWTILGLPSILPWGTVNFGMHSLLGFAPFLLLWFMQNHKDHQQKGVWIGVVCGLLLWASYINVVLVIIALIILFQYLPGSQSIKGYLAFIFVLIAHLFTRMYTDPGFQLEAGNMIQIRGLSYAYLSEIETYKRLYNVYFQALPGSSLIPAIFGISSKSMRIIWMFISTIGFLSSIALWRKNSQPWMRVAVVLIFGFIVAYAISPFYEERIDRPQYVYYRHLTYILPVLSLVAIYGLGKIYLSKIWVAVYIGLCLIGSSLSFKAQHEKRYMLKEAGWVIGHKLGHDPERVISIAMSTKHPESILEGIGWAMQEHSEQAKMTDHEKQRFKMAFMNQIPTGQQAGFERGFSPK